jgi:hypothetical protein
VNLFLAGANPVDYPKLMAVSQGGDFASKANEAGSSPATVAIFDN